MTITTSDIISIVATGISLVAFFISLISSFSAIVHISIDVKTVSNNHIFLRVSNNSSKSICVTGFVLYQDDIEEEFYSCESGLVFFTSLDPIYLTPYKATDINANVELKNFDLSRPIVLRVETTRKNKYFSLDLSTWNNPVVHKNCHYRKSKTYKR